MKQKTTSRVSLPISAIEAALERYPEAETATEAIKLALAEVFSHEVFITDDEMNEPAEAERMSKQDKKFHDYRNSNKRVQNKQRAKERLESYQQA